MRMKMKVLGSVALIAGLLMMGSPLFAHHGDAAYNPVAKEMKGCVITSYSWMNPHSLIKFDYKNDKGVVEHWNFESQPPSILIHAGWTKNSLKPGDMVTIIATPAKNGSTIGLLSKVILADGQELTPTEK